MPGASAAVASLSLPSGTSHRPRLESIDVLRGVIMIIMALDHTRGYFSNVQFYPMDLDKTHVALFFTRWITHFCAPVFVFLAGTGSFLASHRGRSKAELSWFLISRGLWLVVLELTYIKCLGWEFAFDYHMVGWGVLWAIGWSMVVLSALVFTPTWFITGFGLIMILVHNAFDGINPDQLGQFGPLWRIFHAGGKYERGVSFMAGYPLIPWIGVMAAGYGFGQTLKWDAEKRRTWYVRWGMIAIILFVLVRFTNAYGDPKPWEAQSSLLWNIMAMLHCQKYPPSLCYLLMTLGPALLVLAFLDKGTPAWLRPALVVGRVPLFYYLLHLPLIHGLAMAVNLFRFGRCDWLYGWPFRAAGMPDNLPADRGFGLVGVYLAWITVIVILYPFCRWFADLKQRRKDVWLSYL
jgi:uncharacterized membrane protein